MKNKLKIEHLRLIKLSKLHFVGYSVGILPNKIIARVPHYYNLNKFMENGIPYNNTSINTFVLIISDNYFFIGTVSEENLSEHDSKELININKTNKVETPEIYINVLSEINPITYNLIKFNSHFPVIGSKVYLASEGLIREYIKEISKDSENNDINNLTRIKSNNNSTIDFATLSQDKNVSVNLSFNTLFSKHLGIIGSTGSGKSYTAAKLLLELVKHNQHIILVDPTGEYRHIINKIKRYDIQTFNNKKISISQFVVGDSTRIPYFDLDENELYKLVRPSSGIQDPELKASIMDLRFVRLYNLKKKTVISFMNKKKFNCQNIIVPDKYNREYIHIIGNEDNIYDIGEFKRNAIYLLHKYYKFNMGYNFSELPTQLKQECYSVFDNSKSKKGKDRYINQNISLWKYCASLSTRIDTFCHNNILNKYFCKWPVKSNNSASLFNSLNHKFVMDRNITYLDLENVPVSNNITEIIGDYIARKLLLSFINNRNNINDPAVMFVDEAHNFIKKDNPDDLYNLHYFDLIAKEGRKYGLFMTLITQSPYDLSRDVLTQFGTFIIHHLGNGKEREQITSALPYNSNLDKYISSLNTGEAIISSNDLYSPLMVRIHEPSIPPKSNTPKFK